MKHKDLRLEQGETVPDFIEKQVFLVIFLTKLPTKTKGKREKHRTSFNYYI